MIAVRSFPIGSLFLVLSAALLALRLHAADFDKDGLEDSWQAQYGFATNGFASTNLVGWWQMDDGSKTNVLDRSGRNLTGKLTNFVAAPFVPGLYNSALSFSANSHVVFPTTNSLQITNSFTISTWFRGSNANKTTTLARWDSANGKTWHLQISTNGMAQIQFNAATNNVQLIRSTAITPSLYDNQWHHVAAVYNKGSLQATLYVDGDQEAYAWPTSWTPMGFQSFTLGTATNAAFVLDEARLYNTYLSASGVLQLPATYSDPDGDGLTNLQESQNGTNPLLADSDADGMGDLWEITHFGNQNQTPGGDYDADGMSNLYEHTYGLNPKVQDGTSDKDGDGVINQEDADPANVSIGRMTIIISTPTSGSTVN